MRFITLALAIILSIGLFLVSTPGVLPAFAQGDPVFVGAGDIVECSTPGATLTAALLDKIPGTVFTAGDNVYPAGTLTNYKNCFDPTWGRFKNRMRVVPGNHDFEVAEGKDYFTYFGAAAGPADLGYYSFELGAWHIVMLNTNALQDLYDKEIPWLQADLAAHPNQCILAVAHHPVFTSGLYGSVYRTYPLFRVLYAAGASVLVSGSAHDYERFAPQDIYMNRQPTRGIRQFVVGTGGASLGPFGEIWKTTEARDNTTFGVLKFTLHADSYDWQFIPAAGGKYHDSGSAACSHLPKATPTPTVGATPGAK